MNKMKELEDVKFVENISKCHLKFLNNLIIISHFRLMNLNMQIIISRCQISSFRRMRKKPLDKELEAYFKSKKAIEEMGKKYEEFLSEKTYLDSYLAFEEFLMNCLIAAYSAFPKFLVENKDRSEIKIQFDTLFQNNDVEICRSDVVEHKVKDLIQHCEIYELFCKIGNIFSIDLSLNKDEKRKLYEISRNRNIIIHNNGRVNSIYINELKKYKIKSKYEVGEIITEKLENEVNSARDLFQTIAEKFTNDLIGNSKKIFTKHKNL